MKGFHVHEFNGVRGFGDHLLVVLQQALGFGQQQHAIAAQLDLSLAAVEQRPAHLFFEGTHLLANGGVGKGHAVGGGSEAAVLGDGDKRLEKTHVAHGQTCSEGRGLIVKIMFTIDKVKLVFLFIAAEQYSSPN